ncbi:MAG TPA: efflux RND transporter periplasmic adaptor subunit [Candidatus Kapabacteria bacterium]|uniref:efflux RND transporter periplasmic adaptor subunit n=1 Tax=Permianibacter fluminis TaxID=2738515 RepID=UPI001552B1B3|nr:efflux RND transporter periplasmic adaptor subunit [Permianibacter fluminis]NQD37956.1 efflux RND transporter periplasmic adaptor subunit [Permianibacter fluminis]HEX4938042.1 efflux RND transporter periplasmic adaptor subunit [Candidatus Kapabacteria bacterium]
MNRAALIAGGALLLALGLVIGHWTSTKADNTAGTPTERKPLYYRHPMGLPDTSPVPKKDSMGMDYLPVFAESDATRKILYYRNPMGLSDTSPVPKTDSMGMDYLPVYEGEEAAGKLVRISPEKVQKLGVKLESVQRRQIQRPVRAVGTIEADERTLTTIAPRFEGWVETLHANETGRQIGRGQPLFDVYSPELVAAQQEYLLALEARQSLSGEMASELLRTARLRLLNWQLTEADIQALERTRKPQRSVSFRSPINGVILEKMVTQGMRFMPGDALYRLAELKTVWLIANVYEQDLSALQLGQPVTLSVAAFPGESFNGRITFIYPVLADETRTARVRIELPNPERRLLPGMYGHVNVQPTEDAVPVLSVSDSALMDSGKQQLVLVQVGDGIFEPRPVQAGRRGDGYIEILSGLAEAEQVVVSANFLIDAESNLKAAIGSFGHAGHGASPATEASKAEHTKHTTPAEAPVSAPEAAHEGH